jgi:hypothetical protein
MNRFVAVVMMGQYAPSVVTIRMQPSGNAETPYARQSIDGLAFSAEMQFGK